MGVIKRIRRGDTERKRARLSEEKQIQANREGMEKEGKSREREVGVRQTDRQRGRD